MGWIGTPVVSGPLAEHAAGFERWLAAKGYAPQGAWHRLWQLRSSQPLARAGAVGAR